MTSENTLKAGLLAGQDLSLLKAGTSVLRSKKWGLVTVEETPLSDLLVDAVRADGIVARLDATRLSYIGERDADGWIHAPAGGWSENPVPGMLVETRFGNGNVSEALDSECFGWDRHKDLAIAPIYDITAFRRAQTVEGAGECQVPPEGWRCTRAPGHEGPCAALPRQTAESAPLGFREGLGAIMDLSNPARTVPVTRDNLDLVWDLAHDLMASLSPQPTAPSQSGEEDDLDLYDDKVQAGIAWTLRQVGEAVGLTTWVQGDGSESVEGDVAAEIHTILVDAGLRDEETGAMATLATQSGAQASEVREKVARAICDFEWDSSQPSFDRKPPGFHARYLAWADAILAALAPPVSEAVGCSGETWASIAAWQRETFGPVELARQAQRAAEEMDELLADPGDVEEAADVCIVLAGYPGIAEAIDRKMAKNRARQWRLNGDGTGYHVKSPTPLDGKGS